MLKRRSSSRTLCFSSSSAKRRPRSASFRGPKRLKSEGAKSGLKGGCRRTVHPIVAIASLVRRLVCGLALSCTRRTQSIQSDMCRHYRSFSTLRLPSFWPPEGCTRMAPFCGRRRAETQHA
jgi:hypothetical protein